MNNKTNILLQAEEIIKPLALEHVPQDSDVEAVIDQWLHAIATDSQFYCNQEINKPEQFKERVTNLLQQNGAYFGLSGHLFRFHPARRFGVIRPA